MMAEPEITDAELDEIERGHFDIARVPVVIKALRQRSKAKAALLVEIREHCKKGVFQGIKAIRATLDKETDDGDG